jgi:hypothetical protein
VSHHASASFIHHPLSGPSTSAHASGSGLGSYATEDPLETRVVNISMEIAAAIAQAQEEEKDREQDASDEALESEDAEEMGTGKNRRELGDDVVEQEAEEDDEDADGDVDERAEGRGAEEEEEFPEPLRARKGNEPGIGFKRKR